MKIEDTYPKGIQEILREAPLAYGVSLLNDYKSGRTTVAKALKDWKNWKSIHPTPPGEVTNEKELDAFLQRRKAEKADSQTKLF